MKRLLFTLILLLHIPIVLAQEACPTPRLQVGAVAQVTPGDANNVRDRARPGGFLVGQIPGGEIVRVLDGPVCADGFVWWQVDYNGLIGWTVEANAATYFMELIATPEPSATPTPTGPVPPTSTPQPNVSPTPTPNVLAGVGRIGFVAHNNRRLPFEEQILTIYIMNADGSNLRALIDDIPWYAGVFHLSWSPDGALLAFDAYDIDVQREAMARGETSEDRTRRIYLMDAETGEFVYTTPRTMHAWRPAWSPDGSQLLLVVNEDLMSAVYVMDRDGSNLRRLTEPDRSWAKESASWSPDGTTLAVSLHQGDNYDIYLYDIETGKLAQVTTNIADDYDPFWSQDGTAIYFTSYRAEDNIDGVSLYRVVPGERSTLVRAGAFVAGGVNAAPDGRWMAVIEVEDPRAGVRMGRVVVRSLDGLAIPVTDYQFQEMKELVWGR